MNTKEQILQLRNDGYTIRAIAEIVNLSKSVVGYHIKMAKGINVQQERRRTRRKKLLEVFGGKCTSCGYNKSISALDFHHKNPREKQFSICDGIRLAYSFEKLHEEAKKCILLCSNCHHEVHDGILII